MTITPEQLARRKFFLASSDVARVMTGDGVRVTLEKLGEIKSASLDDEPSVQLGHVLEAPVLDAYERATGQTLIRSPDTMMHPDAPWLGCHLDAWAPPHVVVEAKAYSVFNRSAWGDAGTDEVPAARMWQCMAQMAVTGAARADIPVCFVDAAALTQFLTTGTVPIEIFSVPRNEQLIAYMIGECTKVWRCVETKTLPEPVKPGDAELIYRKDNGAIVEGTPEIARAHSELLEVRAQIDSLESREEWLECEIKSFMRDASELRFGGRKLATWKAPRPASAFDAKAFAQSHPEMYNQFIVEKPGSRRFLLKESAT